MFKTEKVNSQTTISIEVLQINVQFPVIQLIKIDIQTLNQLSKEDLVKLASVIGKSHNMVQKFCC